jgi:hypothetical protein
MTQTVTPSVRIAPQPGPQWEACCSTADILIYGGQAGGGKSWLLVAEPTRRTNNPGFRGVIFRRTYKQITGQGGLWDEACGLYPSLGATMREGAMEAEFPSGAKIQFCHLQHEKDKYQHQGLQYAFIGFDELTHFTKSQFFYLLSRNRSICGIKPYIRATCNPDAGSWVAEFIDWWIGPDGTADPERAGKIRYFVQDGDRLVWADSKEELIEQFPDFAPEEILSVTFIPARLDDNPALLKKDLSYKAKLKALPKVERDRLLGGNWRITEGSIIDPDWTRYYSIADGKLRFAFSGLIFEVPVASCKRIATIDTAGTSKERAAVQRGDPPSWSVCAVWDTLPTFTTIGNGNKVILTEFMFLRHVWRDQVEWDKLKTAVPEVLQSWNVQQTYIENAHFGQPLRNEIRGFGLACDLVGPVLPGMADGSEGAKLERAIASTMLTKYELGKILVPLDEPPWVAPFLRELTTWTGLPKQPADQIDVASYAAYVTKRSVSRIGGSPIGRKTA